MGKAKFHASVVSETKTSNDCSSNKEGTINAIVCSFCITSYKQSLKFWQVASAILHGVYLLRNQD